MSTKVSFDFDFDLMLLSLSNLDTLVYFIQGCLFNWISRNVHCYWGRINCQWGSTYFHTGEQIFNKRMDWKPSGTARGERRSWLWLLLQWWYEEGNYIDIPIGKFRAWQELDRLNHLLDYNDYFFRSFLLLVAMNLITFFLPPKLWSKEA